MKFKFFFLLNFILLDFRIISNLKHFISIIILYNEFKKNEKYLIFCNNFSLKKIKKYRKIFNPKISIISSIYNRERYLNRSLISIQYQNFNNIEIILIDDFSSDRSVKIIEEHQNNDERILIIKNKKKRGTFICRNIGALYSNGLYLILPDPDDILSKNILKYYFKFSMKFNYEIIKFNIYRGNRRLLLNEIVEQLESRPIYQPELSSYIFYGNNELQIIDAALNNKFIKKEAYIRGINYLSKYYINLFIINMEDSMMNFIIQHTAKSLFFLKKIGYYYIKNSQSITTNTLFKISGLNQRFLFIYLKLVYEYSKNNKNEKDMFNLLFTNKYNILSKLSSDFINNINFYSKIIKIFFNNKFISRENKIILKDFKYII